MLYVTPTYITALTHLLTMLNRPTDLLGTSLGGICGMELAAAPARPIRRLILNDVGPLLPASALLRIRDYLCAPVPRFADVAMLKLYLRRVHAPFGPLSDAQWLELARNSARDLPGGDVALHYDPAIAIAYAANPLKDLDLWHFWHAIEVPVLTLRGEWSDVLSEATLAQMYPKTQSMIVPQTGHAPALLDGPTIAAVRAFLSADRH